MKKIFIFSLLMLFSSAFSQVIIGDEIGTASNKKSVLLEFPRGQNKGIILPYVKELPRGLLLSEGTVLLDATDPTRAKVKSYNGFGNWVDLSNGNEADISDAMEIQTGSMDERLCGKVIIGATTSSVDGVLILESSSKAMVLPTVLNTNDVVNPAPGMMVFVDKPGAKRLAVYNGAVWTYWKP